MIEAAMPDRLQLGQVWEGIDPLTNVRGPATVQNVCGDDVEVTFNQSGCAMKTNANEMGRRESESS